MSKLYHTLCTCLSAFSFTLACAEEEISASYQEVPYVTADATPTELPHNPANEPDPLTFFSPESLVKAPVKNREVSFSPFTGKVKGRKVRLRTHADLDSGIVRELNKNDLLSVVGDKGEFWEVQPPSGIKAYVFRSFILENTVEGNRVNVRLEPHLDGPIIGHLNAGDKVDGVISAINNKWLEITPPPSTHFYVAKEFVEFAGGPEVKEQIDKRRSTLEQLFDATALLSQAELRKPFEEIDAERVSKGYHVIISDYTDFPEYVDQAKESLASFQEAYSEKKMNHLETLAKNETPSSSEDNIPSDLYQVTDKMKMWTTIEQSLFSNWTKLAENQTLEQYYEEQKLAAVTLTGIVEPYQAPVKSKPGDFIIKNNDLPIAYVYSNVVNLQSLSGKQVKLVASPRPNNNFAFPAYFVIAVE